MNPEEWTTTELFDYLIASSIIDSEENFEDWKYDRTDMLKMVEEDLENYN